jgi:hypothetical protein
MSEIIFEVCEDEVDGAIQPPRSAMATIPKATLEESRAMVKDAVDCYLDEIMDAPKVIRLHFVLDEA